MVPKRFKEKKRAFDERVVVDKIRIIPNHLAWQRRQVHDEPNHRKNKVAGPFFAAEPGKFSMPISANSGNQVSTSHVPYKERQTESIINRRASSRSNERTPET